MEIDYITDSIKGFSKSLSSDFNDLIHGSPTVLNEQQKWGAILSVCYALRHENMLGEIRDEARSFLDSPYNAACQQAVVVARAFNTYYEASKIINANALEMFEHILETNKKNKIYDIDSVDFFLYCFAVSAIDRNNNAVQFYCDWLSSHGVEMTALNEVTKIATIFNAAINAMEIDNLNLYKFSIRDSSM